MGKDKALGENGAYWAQRMRFYEQACARKNAKITAEIDAAFSKANSDIERDLEYWYGRLAKNNGISLAAARRLLDAGELAEFKWSVDEYMAKAMQSGNGRWLKELENASARVHISRLDAMKISMRNTLESAFGRENSIVTKMAGETYRDAVRHTAAEMEKLFKAEFNIGEIDDEKIRKLIRKPWTPDARTFSDRIWAKKNEMINALQEELTRGCIYGRSLDETIARMEKFVDAKFKNAKYAARRIVVTESAFFRVLGTRDELAAIGVEEFQVDLPIGSHSCEICREMNGRIFPMSEFAVGLNAPPFHPNCENGSIIPVMDEDFEAALGEAREEKADQGLTNGENSDKIETGEVDDVSVYLEQRKRLEFEEQRLKQLEAEADDAFYKYDATLDEDDPIKQAKFEEIFRKKEAEVESQNALIEKLKKSLSPLEEKAVNLLEVRIAKTSGIPRSEVMLKGMPFDMAKEVFDAVKKTVKRYPELKGYLTSLKIGFIKVDKEAYAACDALRGRLICGERMKKAAKMREDYLEDVELGFHPAGTDSRAIMVHEMGHALDGYMTLKGMLGGGIIGGNVTRSSKQVQDYVLDKLGWQDKAKALRADLLKRGITGRMYKEEFDTAKNAFIKSEISEYAADNEKEFFAELFAEYVMSPHPRNAAQIFGEFIDTMLGR